MRSVRGNILFLILLAVVLFAALAYAVTSSMRGGGKSASTESANATAAALIQYGSLVENTVQRLMLSNDCKENQLSFENTVEGGYINPAAPDKCKLFNSAGGGMSWQTPPPSAGAGGRYFYTLAPIVNLGLKQDTSPTDRCVLLAAEERAACADLVIAVLDVNEAVCKAVNTLAGYSFPSIPEDVAILTYTNTFNGTFLGRSNDDIGGLITGLGNNLFGGKTTGCYRIQAGQGSYAGKYVFFHALLPR